MTASCPRCSAPLSIEPRDPREAAQGRAPCSACGTVQIPAGPVNPYGPQMGAQWGAFGAAAPGAQPWACATCRHQNEARYEFCLGCGAGRLQRPGGGERGEGREGREGERYEGNSAGARRTSPVVIIAVVVSVLVAGAAVGVVALLLAR
jgi:hypothetical protein